MDGSKPVVVGVDGSEASLEALREAKELAGLLGAPLQTVITWEWPALSGEIPDVIGYQPEKDAREALIRALTEVFGTASPEGVEQVVREGQAARILTELSDGARMLVVGSRGRGGFAGLLIGSVSSTVGAHAHCPVLITHHKREKHEKHQKK
jgi:nucleotide-binding universal stress UspA family protein